MHDYLANQMHHCCLLQLMISPMLWCSLYILKTHQLCLERLESREFEKVIISLVISFYVPLFNLIVLIAYTSTLIALHVHEIMKCYISHLILLCQWCQLMRSTFHLATNNLLHKHVLILLSTLPHHIFLLLDTLGIPLRSTIDTDRQNRSTNFLSSQFKTYDHVPMQNTDAFNDD